MSRYVDKRGGLVVEKFPATESASVAKKSVSKSAVEKIKITGEELVDTFQSYQLASISVNDSSSSGVCKMCGAKTAYKNRHICLNCWTKNNAKIIDVLKTAVKDADFEIE